MTRPPSWKTVADTLAERMSHHAVCTVHPESAPNIDCPWCRDRAAYRMWERKSGQTFVTREVPGELIDVLKLAREPQP